MTADKVFPAEFNALEAFANWALPTTEERMLHRAAKSKEAILAFHEAVAPQVDAIVEYLGQFSLDEIPQDAAKLFDLLLAAADAGPYAEWFDGHSEPPIAVGLTGKIKMIWEPAYTTK